MLQVDDDLWIANAPQRFAAMELGTRMTVVRLSDGSLVLHSPVRVEDALQKDLDRLGVVRALIAPNLYHHLHVGAYAQLYPEAKIYGCPELAKKRPDLRLAGVLGRSCEPWAPVLQHCHIAGNPTHEEIVSFHRASRSLIVADLVSNFHELRGLLMRLFGAWNGWGRFGAPRALRFMIRDRQSARESLDRVLAWDFDRVIMAHGAVLQSGGRDALEAAFSWLR